MSMFVHAGTSKSWRPLILAATLCLGLSHPSLAAVKKAGSANKLQGAKKAESAKKPEKTTAPRLTAEQVIARHVSARGGLQSWRSVRALSLSGKMDAGVGDSVARSMSLARAHRKRHEIAPATPRAEPGKQVQLPFRLATLRPNKSRLEIEFAGKTAVQVYDGTRGWKLRPYLNRTDVEPFTPEEAKAAAREAGIGDPLIDHAAKGTRVKLESVEKVGGSEAYKLRLTTRDGVVKHVWIDARTFLDVKVEGAPRRMDGKLHDVWVYQRDFRKVHGVLIPFVIETVVDGYPQSHKILVEHAAVNPKLDPAAFSKPKA